MKKMFFAAIAPILMFSGVLRAEDASALLRKQYQAVSSEWKDHVSSERRELVRNSKDPQVRRELRFHQELVDDFVKTSRKIQKELEELGLGDDLPLARHAEDLRGGILLYERASRNGRAGADKGKNAPDTVFRMIEADLEGLKEIGFTCENGVGALSDEASAWPEFYRFRRQIRILKLYLDVRKRSAEMNMSVQRNEILREFPAVTGSADQLSAKVMQEFPDLKQEGALLSALTRKLLEEAKLQISGSGLKNQGSASRKSSKQDRYLPQIENILRKIESRIRASFRKEETRAKPVREKRKAEPEPVRTPDPVRKADPAPERKREVPLERRSEEELNGELARLRQQILPDADKNELTADELERCLDLLSEKERRQYETIRLRRIRNGSDRDNAPLETLKEMKELLTAPDAVFPSKQEKIRILKKAQPAEAGE